MKQLETYKNYPCSTIIVSNVVATGIYFIGLYIIYQIGVIWLLFYLFFMLGLETRLMKKGCVDCYYYGKLCAFGRGKLSSIFFKKGNSKRFAKHKFTLKDILPDFLVSIIPLVLGTALLIIRFNWLILVLITTLVLLTSLGNGFVRGSLACKFCKQREIGCPAEQLFNKNRK